MLVINESKPTEEKRRKIYFLEYRAPSVECYNVEVPK